jgi:regulator of replication initiation timing
MCVRIARTMDRDEKSEYIERLEHRIEILSNENAALMVTLNKLLRENMKLKAEIKRLEMRIAALQPASEITLPPENSSE